MEDKKDRGKGEDNIGALASVLGELSGLPDLPRRLVPQDWATSRIVSIRERSRHKDWVTKKERGTGLER